MYKLPLIVSAAPSGDFWTVAAGADFASAGCLAAAILALPSANSRIAAGKYSIVLFIAFTSKPLRHMVARVSTIPGAPPQILQAADRLGISSLLGAALFRIELGGGY